MPGIDELFAQLFTKQRTPLPSNLEIPDVRLKDPIAAAGQDPARVWLQRAGNNATLNGAFVPTTGAMPDPQNPVFYTMMKEYKNRGLEQVLPSDFIYLSKGGQNQSTLAHEYRHRGIYYDQLLNSDMLPPDLHNYRSQFSEEDLNRLFDISKNAADSEQARQYLTNQGFVPNAELQNPETLGLMMLMEKRAQEPMLDQMPVMVHYPSDQALFDMIRGNPK